MTADSIVLDTVAPTTTAPTTSFQVGSTLGSALATTPIPLVTSWSGADATSGIASYDLRASVDGGTPTISATTATTITQSLVAGKQYSYGVRATDRAANTSPWGTADPLSISLTQESDAALAYTGTWASETSTTASGEGTRYTTDPSATVAFTFTGRTFAWVAPLGPTSGPAKVEMDGVPVATVPLNAAAPVARRIVYTAQWPTVGEHTVKIKNAGTTTRIDLDAFVVGSTPLVPPDTTTPDTTITSGPAAMTTATDASFGFSASEPGAAFQCKLDGPGAAAGSWTACSSPKNYMALAQGKYKFSVRATDQGGNIDATPATRSFTVDTVAPDTTITSGPAGMLIATAASFGFSASEPGASFQCKLDGPGATAGSWTACSSPKTYSALAQGDYTFSVRATDQAGNTDATPAARAFTV